jgi:hypothetical protein
MKIQHTGRALILGVLLLLGLMAYKTTAVEPAGQFQEKQSCSKALDCTPKKTIQPKQAGHSIIWDSMTDNLLSARI